MAEYGIISREVPANSAAELFRKTKEFGFGCMQFSFGSFFDEETPAIIPDRLVSEIAREAAANGIKIAAVSGIFNMAHPDPAVRKDGISRFRLIAASCKALGAGLASVCTGTRNEDDMWTWHPDNETGEAWQDMSSTMEQLLPIAEEYGIKLGIETEASNVVNTPEKARKLLDQFKSPRLKIIMDAANLFLPGTAKPGNIRPVIANAFRLLGPWTALAHGKDIMA
ncbi:MAG: sugar phosphate isomerase/epimerase, partial [Treponema sp.]|nr:sugar phosphate isomerase/epimerase [Treponema sp.]